MSRWKRNSSLARAAPALGLIAERRVNRAAADHDESDLGSRAL